MGSTNQRKKVFFTRSQSAKNREIMLGIQHERPPMVNKKMCVLAYLKRYESALGLGSVDTLRGTPTPPPRLKQIYCYRISTLKGFITPEHNHHAAAATIHMPPLSINKNDHEKKCFCRRCYDTHAASLKYYFAISLVEISFSLFFPSGSLRWTPKKVLIPWCSNPRSRSTSSCLHQ